MTAHEGRGAGPAPAGAGRVPDVAGSALDGAGRVPDVADDALTGGTGTVAYPPPQTWPTGRLLSAAARRIERAWDAYLERWGLTHASVPVLVVLAGGPLSQRQIAAQMHVTEQALGRVVRNLEQSGHVTRQRHPVDRRRLVVALTPTGREALASLDDKKATEALIGTSLTPEGVADLRALLIQLVTDNPRPTPATDDQSPGR